MKIPYAFASSRVVLASIALALLVITTLAGFPAATATMDSGTDATAGATAVGAYHPLSIRDLVPHSHTSLRDVWIESVLYPPQKKDENEKEAAVVGTPSQPFMSFRAVQELHKLTTGFEDLQRAHRRLRFEARILHAHRQKLYTLSAYLEARGFHRGVSRALRARAENRSSSTAELWDPEAACLGCHEFYEFGTKQLVAAAAPGDGGWKEIVEDVELEALRMDVEHQTTLLTVRAVGFAVRYGLVRAKARAWFAACSEKLPHGCP